MNHMTSIARSAVAQCARFTALSQPISKAQDSIQQINNYTQPVDNLAQKAKLRSRHSHVIHMLDRLGTLSWLEPFRGSERAASRIARSVAIVIGIALSIANAPSTQGSIDHIQSVKQLASIQLTDKQYHCHNSIIYRESRFKANAVNGSHYGYYQGRSRVLLGAPADYQFYWYWSYVSHRYGITQYDEPDMCKALHHLRVKGWQ